MYSGTSISTARRHIRASVRSSSGAFSSSETWALGIDERPAQSKAGSPAQGIATDAAGGIQEGCQVLHPTGCDMLTKLTTAIAGVLPPDLVMIDIAFTAQFADRDVLMDIGQIVTNSGMKEDAFKGYDVGATWKGKYISYPMWSDCSALYFNKKLFTEAGVPSLEGPKNWQEVQEQASAVHGLGDDIFRHALLRSRHDSCYHCLGAGVCDARDHVDGRVAEPWLTNLRLFGNSTDL